MAVSGMHYNWGWAYGGDDGYSVSLQYNFGRSYAVAQVSLSGANGDGLCMGGITQYRKRPVANGPDQDVNFGWSSNYGYPPSVYDPNMTSASATLEVGGNGQQGVITLNVWFFS
jgi:hypothetical protein